jgi:hypothetical protein
MLNTILFATTIFTKSQKFTLVLLILQRFGLGYNNSHV